MVSAPTRERQCMQIQRLFHRMLEGWLDASVIYCHSVPGTPRGFWVYCLPVFKGTRIIRMWLGATYPGSLVMTRGIRFRYLRDERMEVLDRLASMIPSVARAVAALAD